ncbi:transposase [Streptomyces sp. 769]|nr:hypothetical protein [Streptomyces sp. 769]AJC56669.1 transposase [Streptomyces sp. 769]
MTEIVTEEGKLHLAMLIDLLSQRLFGYAMGARHDTDLIVVVVVLNMAAAARGVIFHSDRGSEPGLNRSSQHRLPGLIKAARWAQ